MPQPAAIDKRRLLEQHPLFGRLEADELERLVTYMRVARYPRRAVLFRKGGAQKVMPAGLAVAAITMTGYAGVLVGPAGVGFAADHLGLPGAFWLLALLLCVAPLCAGIVTRNQEQGEANADRSYRSVDV